MYGTYIGNGRMLVRTKLGSRLILSSDNLDIMPELVAEGIHDTPLANLLPRLLKPGDRCIDVGANVGLFTVEMAMLVGSTGSVVAFEPNPSVCEFLLDNIAVNNSGGVSIGDWVTVRPGAAYDWHDTVTLHTPRRNAMWGSLHAPRELERTRFVNEVWDSYEVPAEPLDDVIGATHVQFVKIDVEGGEPEVFAGMARSMDSGQVDVIAFELDGALIRDYEEFSERLRRLEDAGWRYFTAPEDGSLCPIGVESMLAQGRFGQIVMARPE